MNYINYFAAFGLGATPGSTQGLFPGLHSRIAPEELKGQHGVLGIEPGWLRQGKCPTCYTNALALQQIFKELPYLHKLCHKI